MFEDYLKSFGILSDKDFDLLTDKTYTRYLTKGDYFAREGETSNEVAYVQTGILRSYYFSSEGDEVTHCFMRSNSFVSAYASFITRTKSQESIQALSETELICMSSETIRSLEETSMNWLKLSKVIAQQEYLALEKRIFLLQKESAEKRYADLLKNQPELLQLVSLEQLSSYLGISQRHLSRIRGAVSI